MRAVGTSSRPFRLRRHLVVLQRPFPHEPDPPRRDPVDDQLRVVDRPQVVPQQRVLVLDFPQEGRVGDHLGEAVDADLIVAAVQVAQLDPGIGLDFLRLVVAPEVGDVDGEALGADRGDGTDPGLLVVLRTLRAVEGKGSTTPAASHFRPMADHASSVFDDSIGEPVANRGGLLPVWGMDLVGEVGSARRGGAVEALIFIGLQGAGKSSFYLDRFFDTHIRISLDVLKTRHRERRVLQVCVETGLRFVVANTNPTRAERRVYLEAARGAGFRVVGYYFRSRVEDCMRRNEGRTGKGRIPSKGLLGTAARMELPSLEEGFDELHYVWIGEGGGFVVEGWRDEDGRA